jgi:hypothetical protein
MCLIKENLNSVQTLRKLIQRKCRLIVDRRFHSVFLLENVKHVYPKNFPHFLESFLLHKLFPRVLLSLQA